MMKKNFKVAFGGILTAFSVILILLGNIPLGEYIGPTFAGILLSWAVVEMGDLSSVWIYAAASLLSFILSGNKEPALLYALFFGYFPILRDVLQKKINIRVLRWLIKFAVFNLSMLAAYLVLIYLFKMPLDELEGLGKYTVYVLLGAGNILMIVVDFCIDRLIVLYKLKWQKRIWKMLKIKK